MMTLLTRLFGRRHDRGETLGFVQAQRMVLDYARFLEKAPPMPGRVIDAGRLPHRKERLKAAMLMCLSNSSDPRLEEHLRHGYLMLSAFQDNVGEAQGVDFAALDLAAEPLDIATAIELAEESTQPWQSRVRAELEQLKQDLFELELQLSEPERLSA